MLQSPLIETRPSLAALERARQTWAPNAVYLGIGVCSSTRLSEALPVDVFGVLLPAEQLRQALDAPLLVVCVADAHALSNDFDEPEVASRAGEVIRILWRIRRRFSFDRMLIVRGSSFHETDAFRRVLAHVQRRATEPTNPYFVREVADIEYLNRVYGGILKVGWTISAGNGVRHRRDEVAFDRRFRRWVGRDLCAVYCKAGRTLDDRRVKTVPYTTEDPATRVCLRPDEDVPDKLDRAAVTASETTVRGVRNHLKAVTRVFTELVEPLEGPVEQRVQSLIAKTFEE